MASSIPAEQVAHAHLQVHLGQRQPPAQVLEQRSAAIQVLGPCFDIGQNINCQSTMDSMLF